jgi:N-acetyl-beta-hexosaminidase
MLRLRSRRAIVYEEGWNFAQRSGHKLPSHVTVAVWNEESLIRRIVETNTKVISMVGWYLDQQRPGGRSVYAFEDTWQLFYRQDPVHGFLQYSQEIGISLPARKFHFVLGGEASMWSEAVDAAALDGKVWPRTCAVAERLWSSGVATVLSKETAHRLETQRCRMVRAGIRASAVKPGYCDTGPLIKIQELLLLLGLRLKNVDQYCHPLKIYRTLNPSSRISLCPSYSARNTFSVLSHMRLLFSVDEVY